MVFSIILILLVLLVAFFHFIQGMFSATLSAIFAVIAAAVAVGFHENVVALMKPGKLADSGTAVILCSLFAVTYVVLRLIFDRTVPGNVRLQSTVDKVGAAIMGLVAGIMTAGILAIAAQTMPFGPSIFGYARYQLADARGDFSFQAIPDQRALTRTVTDAMKSDTFKDEEVNHLLIPVDDIVINTVSALSEGSLSGTRPLALVHPNYLQEAFGKRVGLEPGARQTATNLDTAQQVNVEKVFARDKLPAVEDSELPEIRGGKTAAAGSAAAAAAGANQPKELAKLAKAPLAVTMKQKIIIVRARVDKNATDEKGNLFRFSPGAVRLVTHDANGKAKDYFARGTMDTWGGGTFWPSRPDDPLFLNADVSDGAEFVFVVDDADEVYEAAAPPAKPPKGAAEARPAAAAAAVVKDGTFMEVKWLARVNLGGQAVDLGSGPLADPKFDILRKVRLKAPPPPPQPG